MKAEILLVLTLAVTGLGVVPPAAAQGFCDGTPYVVGNRPSDLLAADFDPDTGAWTLNPVAPLTLDGEPISVNALAIRSTDGLLYGWADSTLVTIDPDLGATPLASPLPVIDPERLPVYFAGDITPDGTTYYLLSLEIRNEIYVLDLTVSPLTLSRVVMDDVNIPPDIAVHPTDGRLYGATAGQLVRVDPVSGEIVRWDIVSDPDDPFAGGGSAWFDRDGDLVVVRNDNGVGGSELWEIDLETLEAVRMGAGPALFNSDGARCDGDSDGDGVPDGDDLCSGTVTPETVPTRRLGVNRFALTDDSGVFSTRSPRGRGPRRSYTIEDTAGCSCEQIIFVLELGEGHRKHGCSISAMDEWVASVPFLP